LRKLNDAYLHDPFPTLFTDKVLDNVGGQEAYSFIDGVSGYHQIKIVPKDRYKTTFAMEWGSYQYTVMRFMEELGKQQENNMLYCDNHSAIHIAKNSTFHSKTKHIQLRYHFIQFFLGDGKLKLEKIHNIHNLADMLTKVVTRKKLSSCSI
jgi:hypothetical protein